jgi:hypothetical protein
MPWYVLEVKTTLGEVIVPFFVSKAQQEIVCHCLSSYFLCRPLRFQTILWDVD